MPGPEGWRIPVRSMTPDSPMFTPRQIPATLRQPRQASREAKHNLLCLSSVVDPFPSPSIDPLHRKNSQLSALSEAAPSESALSSQRSHSSAAAEPKPIQVLPKQPVAAAVRPLPQQRQLVSGPAVQALQLGDTSPPATPNPLDRLLRSRVPCCRRCCRADGVCIGSLNEVPNCRRGGQCSRVRK